MVQIQIAIHTPNEFNKGMSTRIWNLVEGQKNRIGILTSGWGPTQIQTSNLPSGFTLENNIIQYDGVSQITNQSVNVIASNDHQSFQLNLLLRVKDIDNLQVFFQISFLRLVLCKTTSNSNLLPKDVTSGTYSGCIVAADGELRCWGIGTNYQLDREYLHTNNTCHSSIKHRICNG